MEVLAALGYGAKELFSYNRENFKFDQDQRIERETLRLEMQVKRFELFREDVHDLVELTVDRMDVYHLVGALFLEFCIVLFCEGRIQASAPPFLLSLFLLSNACAFIYLLLAVWLSMHASIAAHSFGVRLLTRFVRLPIPSIKQITALRSRLKDYESQGVGNLLRLPFQDKQEWTQVDGDAKDPGKPATEGGTVEAVDSKSGLSSATQLRPGSAAVSAPAASSSSSGSRQAATVPAPGPGPAPALVGKAEETDERPLRPRPEDEQFLANDMDSEFPMGGEDLLSGKHGARPERHIQLFRQLQSKWQCYDAYCRVCMGLGVNQILQALSYYCICHTLVENHSPTTGYALVMLFQCTTVALAVLDLAGMKRREIIAVQVVGVMPCLITAWGVAHGRRERSGVLDPDQWYPLSPLSFLLQVAWLELWLRVASPSTDQARLPRRFRQVLFLDVFGDAEGWDPTQAEDEDAPVEAMPDWNKELSAGGDDDDDHSAEEALDAVTSQAATQLTLVQCAMRRWQAVPASCFSAEQRKELDQLTERFLSWGNTLAKELERRPHQAELQDLVELELRPWQELSPEEHLADPFNKCLLGPFEDTNGQEARQYHYDLDSQQTIYHENLSKVCPGALVLELEAVGAILRDLEHEARHMLELRITRDLQAATRRQQRLAAARRAEREKRRKIRFRKRSSSQPKRAVQQGAFPNLVSLFRKNNDTTSRRAMDREQGVELLSASAAHEPPVASPSAQQSAGALPEDSLSTTAPLPATPQSAGADQTLVAMAGEHARHFVPERLPWQVLSRMTRVLQLCWFYSGVMALLKETDIYQVDYQQHPGHGERRLCASPAELWPFQPMEFEWPHGDFFRAQGLFCHPEGDLLIGSPFAVYRARATIDESKGDSTWRLEELERRRLPVSAAAACLPVSQLSAPVQPSCVFVVSSTQGTLSFWQQRTSLGAAKLPTVGFNQSQTLKMDGEPWSLLTGAILKCNRVTSILPSEEPLSEWCLLLAGWDGLLLPVAAVPLNSVHGQLTVVGRHVRPAFDVPLSLAEPPPTVKALHLEPQSARLWAILDTGELLAWNLLQAQRLGSWRPQWPVARAGTFQPMAICEDLGSRQIFVLSRGSRLARADVPAAALISTEGGVDGTEGRPAQPRGVRGGAAAIAGNTSEVGTA